MAAPPALSIREQLCLDLVSTLQGVTIANGYTWDIGTVSRGQLAPLEISLLPLAAVMPLQDIPVYGAGVLRRTFTVKLRLWVDVALKAETAPGLESLLADVQRAIRVDAQRSTLAEDTREVDITYLYLVESETLAGADLDIEIDYRTDLDSPLVGA